MAMRFVDLHMLDGQEGFSLPGLNAYGFNGVGVSGVGDLNGDGYGDFMVGDQMVPLTGLRGDRYILFGSAEPFPIRFNLTSLNGSNGFTFRGIDTSGPYEAKTIGDINNDGLDDLIIGESGAYADNVRLAGQAYVVYGRTEPFPVSITAGSLTPELGFTIKGTGDRTLIGTAVSAAGDFNGDGVADLAVSGQTLDYDGRVWIIFGGADGQFSDIVLDPATIDRTTSLLFVAGLPFQNVGTAIDAAGDVNGDGIDDLLIGGRGVRRGDQIGIGEAYVLFGRTDRSSWTVTLPNAEDGFVIKGIKGGDLTGFDVSGAGDINGDGLTDFLVSARGATVDGMANAGQVFLIFGRQDGFGSSIDLAELDGTTGVTISGAFAYHFAGQSIDGGHDFNGDGYDDILIGAPGAGISGEEGGGAYLIFGRPGVYPPTISLALLDASTGLVLQGQPAESVGFTVAFAGDVNGDGYADVLVGSPGADVDGLVTAGTSYLVYGRAVDLEPGFDDHAAASVFRPVTVSVLANDGDIGSNLPRLGAPSSHGLVLQTVQREFVYLPDPFFTGQDAFTYTIESGGRIREVTVTLTVSARSPSAQGTYAADRIVGSREPDLLLGLAGNDLLLGREGNDLLIGGSHRDQLFGGKDGDILDGGDGADFLKGGDGADIFLLKSLRGIDLVRDFSVAAGDRLLLAVPELLLADGRIDGRRLNLHDEGTDLELLVDPEGDGSFRELVELDFAAGLTLSQLLVNAVVPEIA